MHIKCSGLSTKNDHHLNFNCKHCREPAKIDPQETAKHGPTIETPPEPFDCWKNFQDEQTETLRKIYNEIVHWKPIFTIRKNKVGFKIADVMNIILIRTLEDGLQSDCAMICTKLMPHLLFERSKKENDASKTKTLSRRLDLWIRCKFNCLFVAAKARQECLKKLNKKREVYEFNAFDKQMESGKISNALRCLSEDAKGGVL